MIKSISHSFHNAETDIKIDIELLGGICPSQCPSEAGMPGDYAGWMKIVIDEKYCEILSAHAAEGMPIDI